MSSTTTRWGRCAGILTLALGALVGPLATPGVAGSPVVQPTSVLAPGLVSTNRTAFYAATWVDESQATLTNPVVTITLPAGSALLSADPPGCTASFPSGPSGAVVVSCPRDNLASGAGLTQQLLFRVPAATVLTSATVRAQLTAKEAGSDTNKSHIDTFPAPDQTFTIVPGAADAAGGCLQDGDVPLATQPGLSATNPLITTAALAGTSGLVCVPLTVQEKPAASPTDACGAGATCTTDIATTEFVQLSQLPNPAIALTFTVVGTNKNLTWYKNGIPVVDCTGATSLPPGLSACITARSKPTAKSVQLDVLWRAGPDPSWRG